MAAMGIPLLTIQLMARWASDIVMRYVGEAPLMTVTAAYRQANASLDLQSLLSATEHKLSAVQLQIDGLDDRTRAQLQEELDLRRQVAEPARGSKARRGPAYVVSQAGILHVPANPYFSDRPAHFWKSRCGWRFGSADYSHRDAPRPHDRICNRCARPSDSAVDAPSSSSSSS
jgi:hypothetical protein